MNLESFQDLTKNPEIYPNHNSYELISLKNISHFYGELKALDSINLSIRKREIIFITGASGAGKTTLLKMISKMISPSKGNILLKDDLFLSNVFQDLKLIEHYSVYENIKLVYSNQSHKSIKLFNQELDDLLDYFDLKKYKKKKICELNGGSKQKVALVRALICHPDVLIADEPTCSMDLKSAESMFELVNFYNLKKEMTLIWATHDRDLVKKFHGRTIHLDNGKIIHSGNTCFI